MVDLWINLTSEPSLLSKSELLLRTSDYASSLI